MEIKKIIEIAEKTNQKDLLEILQKINFRLQEKNATLLLPLVGEFSSGKTTLINALTDCKQLETATKPTTSTIFEVSFGHEQIEAFVTNKDGTQKQISDMSELKNDNLEDALLVELYDTAKTVAPSTVLIDTPGLSSPNQKHKEVLLEFIPQADAILLVTDINQQITKSLVDFCKSISLVNRPIYLIVTKCDTKSLKEIAEVKEHILKNAQLQIKDVAFVSAKENNLEELYTLLKKIDEDKSSILKSVNEERVKNIAQTLINRIDDLLNVSNDSSLLDGEIKAQSKKLENLKRNIERLIEDVKQKLPETENNICRDFNNKVFERLESLVVSNCTEYDKQAVAEINALASQSLENYKQKMQQTVYSIANERRNTDLEINLASLNDLNYDEMKISSIPYSLNLNELGHQYDKYISVGVKVLTVAGAVAVGIATGGASAIASVVAGSVDAMVVGGVSLAANKQLLRQQRMQKMQQAINQIPDAIEKIEGMDNQFGEKLGEPKGFVEGIVSKITDKTSKPERRRAIHAYIDDILEPSFKSQLQRLSNGLLSSISNTLNEEAKSLIEQRTNNLRDLQSQKEKEESEYHAKIKELTEYKKQLISA